jgi:hypothetical protein
MVQLETFSVVVHAGTTTPKTRKSITFIEQGVPIAPGYIPGYASQVGITPGARIGHWSWPVIKMGSVGPPLEDALSDAVIIKKGTLPGDELVTVVCKLCSTEFSNKVKNIQKRPDGPCGQGEFEWLPCPVCRDEVPVSTIAKRKKPK